MDSVYSQETKMRPHRSVCRQGVPVWEQTSEEVKKAFRGVLESSEELFSDCSRRGLCPCS